MLTASPLLYEPKQQELSERPTRGLGCGLLERRPNPTAADSAFEVHGSSHCVEDASEESSGSEDCENLETFVKSLLRGIGEDAERQGLMLTPARVVRAFHNATKGYTESTASIIGNAVFDEASAEGRWGGGNGGIVLIRDIETFSCCCSCLLPMKFLCHLAYIPSKNRVVGLSKFPRVADAFSKRLQNPKRFASQVVKSLSAAFKPLGIAVTVKAWHLSENSCGSLMWKEIRYGGKIACAAEGGFLSGNKELLQEFLALISLDEEECDFTLDKQSLNSDLKDETMCDRVLLGSHSLLPETFEKFHSVCKQNGTCVIGESAKEARRKEKNVDSMITSVEHLLKNLHQGLIHQLECIDLRKSARLYVKYLLDFTEGNFHKLEEVTANSSPSPAHSQESSLRHAPISESNGCTCFIQESLVSHPMAVPASLSVPFSSLCEHHLLPFFGHVRVGYISSDVGRAPLQMHILKSIVELYARRLQVQERMTWQIAEGIHAFMPTEGVIVISTASHMCMSSRGIEKANCFTTSIASLGVFAKDAKLRTDFIRNVHARGRTA